MFSPIGKKKILIQKKFGGSISPLNSRPGSPTNLSLQPRSPGSPSRSLSPDIRELRAKLKEQVSTSVIAATSTLETALCDPGVLGDVMRSVLDATARYRPERDSITLKAFESKTIDYNLFRQSLHNAFWLTFTDEEFNALAKYFDPSSTQLIDGYSFMIAFTRLSGIRKGKEATVIREKQETYERQMAAEQEKKRLEKEKRLELAVDYNYSADVKVFAMKKLQTAAKNFDPGHPSAPSTRAFDVAFLKPAEFREMMKLIFNLKLDKFELGAILQEFKPTIVSDGNKIPATEFLKYFFRIGFEAREKEKANQRQLQQQLDQKAEEEARKKREDENRKKLSVQVNFDFNEDDERSAMEKQVISAEKYDKAAPGSVSLDGFECEELPPVEFKDLVRRVFNFNLSPGELGYIVTKYDVKKTGSVHCKTFLQDFLTLGVEKRYEKHLKQLENQQKNIEKQEKAHLDKMKSVLEGETVPYSEEYSEEDYQSALNKLTKVAVFYDKSRGGTLSSFEPLSLSLVDFKRGLKRSFNMDLTAREMGALYNSIPRDDENKIVCQHFMNTFITLGAKERDRLRTEQLQRQKKLLEEAEAYKLKKLQEASSKQLYEVEYEFDDEDRANMLEKTRVAAKRYDSKHPAALSLQAFEIKSMSGPVFKENIRRTFQLALAPKEVGAMLQFIRDRADSGSSGMARLPYDHIDCGEFIKYFLTLGISERNKVHSKQLEKQRREDLERQKEMETKLAEAANRSSYAPDMQFTESDIKSIQEKVSTAAEKFDKSHPAAPSLEAFNASYMAAGNFRENIKSIFGIKASPKEIGYLLSQYDKEKNGSINTKEFLIKFFQLGKQIRDDKRRAAMEKQRAAEKQAALENEMKLTQLLEKSDYEIDADFGDEDFDSAERKMTVASEKYDKTHPAAPNLSGFTGGPVPPGVFRELMKNAFKIYFSPVEVGALLERFHMENDCDMFDGKKFLIYFVRLGFDARAKRKTEILRQQRTNELTIQQQQEQKLQQLLARSDIDLDSATYTDLDRERALQKLTMAAALYDKTAPGSVSLDSFHALYLTPGNFRETMKRTFNILFTSSELAAMIAEFNNGDGNIDTNKFLVSFVRWGSEEREKQKLIQMEKQRKDNTMRETLAEEKEQQKAKKLLLSISYDYTPEHKEKALQKLATAAKKFDKSHPAAMSLDGFEEKYLKPHVFREMLKRTFNLNLAPEELGALIHCYDKHNSGEISSQDFLIHFLKLGIAERDREHKESLRKLREDAMFREKYHQDKLAAQWGKAELNVTFDFSAEERDSALEKLTEASVKFDPASAGPMGLTAFHASVLSPAVFREMLRRVFRMKLTNGELAALIAEFDKEGNKHINCQEFLVTFQTLGNDKKNEIRLKQIAKQRQLMRAYGDEMIAKKQSMDSKLEVTLDHTFGEEDFQSALEKIRTLAKNYDRSHPSAPSLKGFSGADMKPNEFRDMLMRTFHMSLTVKELSALVAFFPGGNMSSTTGAASSKSISGDKSVMSTTERSISSRSGSPQGFANLTLDSHQPRINSCDFLTYFNKLNREEFMKRNTARIMKEKQLKDEEKKRLQSLENEKIQTLLNKLTYQTPQDQLSFTEKAIEAAKEFATDSAPYIDLLQGFKGPALPPDKFRGLFYQIFGIKFTMAETGVLVDVLGCPKDCFVVMDGTVFLNWFYKVARMAEAHLLNETNAQPLTWETIGSIDMGSKAPPQRVVSPRSLSSKSPSVKKGTTYSAGDFRANSISPKGRGNTIAIVARTPVGQKNKQGFFSTSSTEGSDAEDGNSVSTQTEKKKHFAFPAPSNTKESRQTSQGDGKRANLSSRSSLISTSSGSRKRYKGFGSISLSQNSQDDNNDFLNGTLDRSWFLPSLLGSNSNGYSLEHLDYQQDLEEIFARSELPVGSDDQSVLTVDSSFLDKLIGTANRSFDASSSHSQSRGQKRRNGASRNTKSRQLLSQSMPDFLIPNMAYASLGNTAKGSLESAPSNDESFLRDLFSNTSMDGIDKPIPIKIPGQKPDPATRIKQLSQKMRESPMQKVASRSQSRTPMEFKRRKTPPGNNLAPLHFTSPPSSSSKPMTPNKKTNSGHNSSSSEVQDSTNNPSSNPGGFFFPVLLVSGTENSEKDSEVIPSNNIGLVGESEAHPDYLRKLLVS